MTDDLKNKMADFSKLFLDSIEEDIERSKCPRSVVFNSDVVNKHDCFYMPHPNRDHFFELAEFFVAPWIGLPKAIEQAYKYMVNHYGHYSLFVMIPLALYCYFMQHYDATAELRSPSIDEICASLGINWILMTPDEAKDIVKPVEPTELYRQRKKLLY